MPRRKRNTPPAYPTSPHASGQARIVVNGKSIYLGGHGSKESYDRYAQVVAQWVAGRTKFDDPRHKPLTIAQLAVLFLEHADRYYVKNGRPTSEAKLMRFALRPLIALFAAEQAREFGPLKLALVRDDMIRRGWSLKTINSNLSRLKLMWKWAARNELVPGSCYEALRTVESVKAGRQVPARPKVQPVSLDVVDQTLAHVKPAIAGLIWTQRLTGCRPGEAVRLRASDIRFDADPAGVCWLYEPDEWKTMHHDGLERRSIWIGPKLQAILAPFLLECPPGGYLFRPKRRERYSVRNYCRAVERACRRHSIQRWRPNQLRHTLATMVRKQTWGADHKPGVEAAKVILGHSNLPMTLVYAEDDRELARDVMRKIG